MFFKYRVKWCYEEETPISYGLGKARNFADAMKQIAETFGDEDGSLWEVNIEWISDDELLDIDDLYESYKREEIDAPKSEVWEEVVEALNEAVMQKEDENERLERDN